MELDYGALYERERRRHRYAIESGSFAPVEHWGRNCLGYNLQLILSDATLGALGALQREIQDASSEAALYRLDPNGLHITVTDLLPSRFAELNEAEGLWRRWADRCQDLVAESYRSRDLSEVQYCTVYATPNAILACAKDPGEFAEFRHEIEAALPAELGPKQERSLIHTTLFRCRAPLARPVALLGALDDVSQKSLPIAATVVGVAIHRQTRYPALQSEAIWEYTPT